MSTEGMSEFLSPGRLSYYEPMTKAGPITVSLSRSEQAVILHMYDNGVGDLTENELMHVYSALRKLKQEIWP